MVKKRLLVSVSFLLFGIIAYLVSNDLTEGFDRFIYNIITFNKNDILTGFYKFITGFASEIIVAFVSLVFFLVFKNKKYAFFVFLNAVNIVILNMLLKLTFMRDRPYELMIITEDGYSFPSGHAMAALGFYGFIIYLIWHFNLTKKVKIIFTIFISILIILIGFSRIYLGVHYASDVLAGFMISSAYLIIYISFVKKHLKLGDISND